jgi:hypothetical protein
LHFSSTDHFFKEHFQVLEQDERSTLEAIHSITKSLYDLVLGQSVTVSTPVKELLSVFQNITFSLKASETSSVAATVQLLEKIVIPFDACMSLWAQFFSKYKGQDVKQIKADLVSTRDALIDKLVVLSTELSKAQKENYIHADETIIETEEWKRFVEVNSATVNTSFTQTLSNLHVVVSESLENVRSKFE